MMVIIVPRIQDVFSKNLLNNHHVFSTVASLTCAVAKKVSRCNQDKPFL